MLDAQDQQAINDEMGSSPGGYSNTGAGVGASGSASIGASPQASPAASAPAAQPTASAQPSVGVSAPQGPIVGVGPALDSVAGPAQSPIQATSYSAAGASPDYQDSYNSFGGMPTNAFGRPFATQQEAHAVLGEVAQNVANANPGVGAMMDFGKIVGPSPEAKAATQGIMATSAAYSGLGAPAPARTMLNLDAAKQAISSIESTKGSPIGDYNAIGPLVKGDRAYGRYQVMGTNVGPWSKQYYGQELTPQEFVSNPAAQDAVFEHVFSDYVDKYGMAGAAQAWFGGPGNVGRLNVGYSDPNLDPNMTVGSYGSKFVKGYNTFANVAPKPVQIAATGPVSSPVVSGVIPGAAPLTPAALQYPSRGAYNQMEFSQPIPNPPGFTGYNGTVSPMAGQGVVSPQAAANMAALASMSGSAMGGISPGGNALGVSPGPLGSMGAPPLGSPVSPLGSMGAPPQGQTAAPLSTMGASPDALPVAPLSTMGAPPTGIPVEPLRIMGAPPMSLPLSPMGAMMGSGALPPRGMAAVGVNTGAPLEGAKLTPVEGYPINATGGSGIAPRTALQPTGIAPAPLNKMGAPPPNGNTLMPQVQYNIPAAAGVGVSPGWGIGPIAPTPMQDVKAAPTGPGWLGTGFTKAKELASTTTTKVKEFVSDPKNQRAAAMLMGGPVGAGVRGDARVLLITPKDKNEVAKRLMASKALGTSLAGLSDEEFNRVIRQQAAHRARAFNRLGAMQIAGGLDDIQAPLSAYARGEMSAEELRRTVKKIAPGHYIDRGGLRGNSHEIPIVAPDGTIHYMEV